MFTPEENRIIQGYVQQKVTQGASLSDIKLDIATTYDWDEEKVKAIAREISEQELVFLAQQKAIKEKRKKTILVAFAYFLAGVLFIAVSVYFMLSKSDIAYNKYLPYIVMIGGVYMLVKSGNKLRKKNTH
jgi:hypothetical protein